MRKAHKLIIGINELESRIKLNKSIVLNISSDDHIDLIRNKIKALEYCIKQLKEILKTCPIDERGEYKNETK
jgi:hypothetical protein